MNLEEIKKIERNQSMVDIAYNILKINKKPMDYKKITDIMVNDIGYVTKGKTPCSTLNSAIGRDYRFSKYRGIVELKEWHLSSNEEKRCLKCGKEIMQDFIFCPFCEFDLKHSCKYCHKKLEPNWRICPYCGKKPGFE
jgi:RNA polymerase subunit RPABC4/transcription elongation factor Spt4